MLPCQNSSFNKLMLLWLGIGFTINLIAAIIFNVNANYTTCVLVVSYFAAFIYYEPIFLMRYPFICFTAVTNLMGVVIIEFTQYYLNELGIYSFYQNSLALISYSWYLFLTTLYILDHIYPDNIICNKNIKIKINKKSIEFKRLLLYFFLILLISISVRVIPRPYFTENVDRFLYSVYFFNDIDRTVLRILNYMVPIIIIFVKDKSKMGIFAFLLYVITRFFMGEKFGLFFNILCYFAIFISSSLKFNKKIIMKYGMRFFLALSLLISVVFVHRILLYNASLQDNLSYIIRRTSQNGQLWWAYYDQAINKKFSFQELNEEISQNFTLKYDIKYSAGIYKVMYKTTPSNIFYSKLENKSRYANSTFASILYYFGVPGILIFSIIAAIFYWLLTHYIIYAFKNSLLFDLIICGRLFSVANTVLTQSDFHLLFSYQTIVSMLSLIFLNFLRCAIMNNHSKRTILFNAKY